MAQNTEHYNLVKPDYADAADVGQLNGNMDIIDDLIWQLANAGGDEEILNLLRQIIALIGETADTGGSTTLGSVMAKLNATLTKIGEGTTGKTIIAMLEELLTQPKVIKHIETGIVAGSSFKGNYNSGYNTTIELTGFSDAGNMIIILDQSLLAASSNDYYPGLYIQSYTNTELIIGSNDEPYKGSSINNMSYQVIEFY